MSATDGCKEMLETTIVLIRIAEELKEALLNKEEEKQPDWVFVAHSKVIVLDKLTGDIEKWEEVTLLVQKIKNELWLQMNPHLKADSFDD